MVDGLLNRATLFQDRPDKAGHFGHAAGDQSGRGL